MGCSISWPCCASSLVCLLTNPRSHSSELLAQYKESLETLSLDRFIAQKDLPRSVYVRELRAPTASSGTQTDPGDGGGDGRGGGGASAAGARDDSNDTQLGEHDFYYSDDDDVNDGVNDDVNDDDDDDSSSISSSSERSESDLAAELSSPWRVAEEFGTGRKYYWNTVTRETRWQIPDRDDPTYMKLVVAAAYRRGQRSNENEIASMQAKVATLQDMVLGSSSLSDEDRSSLARRVASDMSFMSRRRSRSRARSRARSRSRSKSKSRRSGVGGLGGILDISRGAKDGEVVVGRHGSTYSNASSVPPPLPGESGVNALAGLGGQGTGGDVDGIIPPPPAAESKDGGGESKVKAANGKPVSSRLSRVDLGNVIGEGDGDGDGGGSFDDDVDGTLSLGKQRSGTVVIDQSVPKDQSSFVVGSSGAALQKARARIMSVDVKDDEWDSSGDERPKERDVAKLQAEVAAAEEEMEKDREERKVIADKKQYGGKEEALKSKAKHLRKGSVYRKSRNATKRGMALEEAAAVPRE